MSKITSFILCLSCILLLNGCAPKQPERVVQDKFAVVSLAQVMPEHRLYSEYQAVITKITQLQKLQKLQQELSKKQLSSLDKFYAQSKENQGQFKQTLVQIKLLEKQAALEAQLNKKRQVLKQVGQEQILAKRQEIEEKYKLDFFNLRTQQQILQDAPAKFRNEQEIVAFKEAQKKLLAEQQALKQKVEQELLATIKAQEQETELAMQPYYQQAKQELDKYEQELAKQIAQESSISMQTMAQNMQKLPENIQDTLVSIQQELDNLQKRQTYLYQEIYQDIENQATKIALEQGFTVVFKDVRGNITATDITAEVKIGLEKNKEMGKK